MTNTLMILKLARLGFAMSCVGFGCWFLALESELPAPGSLLSAPSAPATAVAATGASAVVKERSQAVLELDVAPPKSEGSASTQEQAQEPVASPPAVASLPREGTLVYVNVDGRAEDFGSVFVRSREGRHFAVREGVLGPAQVAGRYFVRVPGLQEPPQANALGEGREVLLVLRPEVERVIKSALSTRKNARTVQGVLRLQNSTYHFEVQEVSTDAEIH